MNVFDFSLKKLNGEEVSLSEYRGKAVLLVITATHSPYTAQYERLQELYDLHAEDGLEILDVPCNQFKNQAPETDGEILTFCTVKYGVMFPQFAKTDVIGANAPPLFSWLERESEFQGFRGMGGMMLSRQVKKMDPDFKRNNKIKWNFTKFLFDREGNLRFRFEPTQSLAAVKKRIEEIL